MLKNWRIVLFWALVIVVALWIQWWGSWDFPLQHQICGKGEAAHDCDSYNVFFFSARRLAETIDPWSVLITAIATAVVAYFTWTIKTISNRQLAYTRPIERAYMSAGGFWERQSFTTTSPTGHPVTGWTYTDNFELHINNHGKTPGRLLEIAVDFCDASAIPLIPNYTRRTNLDFIGPSTQSRPYGGFAVPKNLVNPVVYGRLWYRDIFSEEIHSSGFIQGLSRDPRNSWLIDPPSEAYVAWD